MRDKSSVSAWLGVAVLVMTVLVAAGAGVARFSALETRVAAHGVQIERLEEALGRIEAGISDLRAGQSEIKGKLGAKM